MSILRALIAFFVKSETNHPLAKDYVLNHQDNGWIILETVFDETVTWVRTRISSSASIKIGQVLRNEHRYVNISDEDDPPLTPPSKGGGSDDLVSFL